jgi:hypothetical protein
VDVDVDMVRLNVQGYTLYEPDFYGHYQEHCSEHGGSYQQYRPAYRYGYDLGIHTRYGAGSWMEIEAEARSLWEARNPGTWDQFIASIHYAWALVSGEHSCVAHDAKANSNDQLSE